MTLPRIIAYARGPRSQPVGVITVSARGYACDGEPCKTLAEAFALAWALTTGV